MTEGGETEKCGETNKRGEMEKENVMPKKVQRQTVARMKKQKL